jgi:REP element-mobilizing transposase RayT
MEGLHAEASLPQFVRQFKGASAFWFKRSRGEGLWQVGYHERMLRSDEPTISAVRYVLDNPVRAGLAASPQDWPFSGAPGVAIDDWL